MFAAATAAVLICRAAAPPAEGVRLDFKEKPWKEVINAVVKPLGLTVQIDFDPPGTFTYSEPNTIPADKALEIVHGALLDRGITLIPKGKMILAVRLADNLHNTLTPFSPASEVAVRRDNLPVFTTIKLNSLNGTQVKSELGGLLSPRGRIVETGVANRVAVWDRCDCVRELMKMLEIIDPPGKNRTVPLRAYQLKHARASEAVQVLSKLLAAPLPAAAGSQMPPGIPFKPPDFAQMGAVLGEKRVVQSFAPGVNLSSAIPGNSIGGSLTSPTEIEFDENRNMVFVRADRDKLFISDRIIESIDRPGFNETETSEVIEIRTYRLPDNNAQKVAAALRDAFLHTPGFFAEGAENRLFVRGPRRKMLEVEQTLARLAPKNAEFAVLPVPPGSAKQLSKQLMTLFEREPQNSRPMIVPDGRDDRILVKGTVRQVEIIRTFAKDVMPPGLVTETQPKNP